MWVKKTEAEIKRDEIKNDRSLTIPFAAFSLSVILQLFNGLDCRVVNGRNRGACWNLEELFQHFPFVLLTSTMLFIAIYFLRSFTPKGVKFNYPETLVCDKCGKAKNNDKVLDCKCGGRYEDLKIMKWIDPK